VSDSLPAVEQPAAFDSLSPVVVVISDLHVGSGQLDDFDTAIELEFVAFIRDLLSRAEPIELVINGDFLEFVQAEPWRDTTLRGATPAGELLCFTQTQSLRKLNNILASHPNVFRALGWFLAKPANRLVIMPGNHDVDLFWGDVRTELRATLNDFARAEVGDRLVYHLSRVYRPDVMPTIWIEHGHQLDVNNRFYLQNIERWSERSPPIFAGIDGEERLLACIGTRFLDEYINDLDQTYPFVDNVKPFSKFVRMFLVGSALFRFGTPIRIAVAAWGILRFLDKTGSQSISALLAAGGQDMPSVAAAVEAAWMELTPAQKADLIGALRARGVSIEVPIPYLLRSAESAATTLDALAKNVDLMSIFPDPHEALLSTGGDQGTLRFAGGFVADETGALVEAAQQAIQYAGARAVIMGHTHEPQDHPQGLNYVNTGSWTRYLRAKDDEPEPSSWSLLKAGAIERFPYNLLYAELDSREPDQVRLKTWRSGT
jgi:UDP-2,3-diacylglucosamine pyrophosphatase LpxH